MAEDALLGKVVWTPISACTATTRIGGTEIRSQGDVMYALHLAPLEGKLDLHWRRADEVRSATIAVTRGWKKTDLGWRRSMRGSRLNRNRLESAEPRVPRDSL